MGINEVHLKFLKKTVLSQGGFFSFAFVNHNRKRKIVQSIKASWPSERQHMFDLPIHHC